MTPDDNGGLDYDEMTMRQKSLVDAIALNEVEDRDLTQEQIVELAHELSGEEKYHTTNVVRFKEEYPEAIEYRKKLVMNERESEENGEYITVGDPMRSYSGPKKGLDATMQYIQERTTKTTQDEKEDWPCDKCDRVFDSQPALAGHQQVHAGELDEEEESEEEIEEGSEEPAPVDGLTSVDLSSEEITEIIRRVSPETAQGIIDRLLGGE